MATFQMKNIHSPENEEKISIKKFCNGQFNQHFEVDNIIFILSYQ